MARRDSSRPPQAVACKEGQAGGSSEICPCLVEVLDKVMKYIKSVVILAVIALVLVACDSGSGNGQSTPGTTQAPVNGFGLSSNHVHSFLVLPSHVLLLATHYGIYRSQDNGA